MNEEIYNELQAQAFNEDYAERLSEKYDHADYTPKYIVKEMLGKDYALFFEDTDERHEKHYWDAKHPL